MKNYAHKTNKKVIRYRTPATFRVRAAMNVQHKKAQRPQSASKWYNGGA